MYVLLRLLVNAAALWLATQVVGLVVEGFAYIQETHTIAGGTGRFPGATGTFAAGRVLVEATGMYASSFDGTFDLNPEAHYRRSVGSAFACVQRRTSRRNGGSHRVREPTFACRWRALAWLANRSSLTDADERRLAERVGFEPDSIFGIL